MYRSLDYILPKAGIKEKFKYCEKNGYEIAFFKVLGKCCKQPDDGQGGAILPKPNFLGGLYKKFFGYLCDKFFFDSSDYTAFAVIPDLPKNNEGVNCSVRKAFKYDNDNYADDRFFAFNNEFHVSIALPDSVYIDNFGDSFINRINSAGEEVCVYL